MCLTSRQRHSKALKCKNLHFQVSGTENGGNLKLRTIIHYLCGVLVRTTNNNLKCRNYWNPDALSCGYTVFITLDRPRSVVWWLTVCTLYSSATVSVQSALPVCGGPWYTLGFLRSTAMNRHACYHISPSQNERDFKIPREQGRWGE
jgi:hypothetical protein